MSYQVLARKYRPRSFRELVGQEHVARALINALDQDRLHHAYLFTGTRGVGKTTIARILAKCLNCETGVSSEPCGTCGTCREIDEGRFVDLIEVDAASRTKVEDTRELLDNVQYAPTRGRYKVYLIDEVHMLSGHSFNALLKTLEEPPPHVKFLLATTDPQKLPITILSRCLQFALKAMSPERVVEHLSAVLQKEAVNFEDAALWELGRAANGSMRDALSLTDQAIAFGNGRLTTAEVRSMLGSIDRDLVFRVLEAVNSGDAAAVLEVCAQLAEQSVDFAGALAELVSTLHRIALAQMLPDAVDNALGDRDRVLAIAAAMTAEDAQLYYQIALHGRRDLPWAADLRSGFEMTLLRMLAFRPVPTAPGTQAGGPGAAPRNAPPGGARPAPRPTSAGPQAMARAPAFAAATVPVAAPAAAMQVRAEQAPVSNVVPFPPAAPAVTVPPSAVPEPEVRRPAPVTPGDPVGICTPASWEQWVRDSGLAGGAMNLARHTALVALEDGSFELQLSARHEILASGLSFGQVEAAFARHFPGFRLRLAKKEPAYTVPMQVIAARKQARLVEAEQTLRNDPVVQVLMRDFQADILPDSITPID
ncbi:MAG: polymerase subunit gamma/tau [Moraxellaceae bacterium]|jgi:DNA polymerase-3 subunit gamma/tau|nr:polymerase subunit gamma/tau [Moraxellaceae bacterium]